MFASIFSTLAGSLMSSLLGKKKDDDSGNGFFDNLFGGLGNTAGSAVNKAVFGNFDRRQAYKDRMAAYKALRDAYPSATDQELLGAGNPALQGGGAAAGIEREKLKAQERMQDKQLDVQEKQIATNKEIAVLNNTTERYRVDTDAGLRDRQVTMQEQKLGDELRVLANQVKTSDVGYKVWERVTTASPENMLAVLFAQEAEKHGADFGPDGKYPGDAVMMKMVRSIMSTRSHIYPEARGILQVVKDALEESFGRKVGNAHSPARRRSMGNHTIRNPNPEPGWLEKMYRNSNSSTSSKGQPRGKAPVPSPRP